MKKIHCLLLATLFYLGAEAQTTPPGENISLDQQLTLVNQSSVTSGIIYERVMQIADLYNFNKTTTFNTANFNYFKQALMEMNLASNSTKFIPLSDFKTKVLANKLESQVDLAILNTQFNILNFNEDNPSQGGLTFNASLYKFTQNTGKVPFYMIHNTVIAPAKDVVSGTAVTYKIRNDLYFKNGTKIIKTLTANFGDGINRTLISNQILTDQSIVVNYSSSGEKISTFQITYTDNTTLTTYGKIYFKYIDELILAKGPTCDAIDPLKQDFTLQADIPFTGYAVGDPTIKAKINYRIFYGNADKKIRKPIIIIDGFDPGDKRKFQDCDCEYDAACEARNTINGVFNPEKHHSMENMMEYYEDSDKRFLLPKLRALGYDVIMVNQPTYTTTNLANDQPVTIDGGAYYVESNAMALVKLIKQTNTIVAANGSTSKIAIVGPSMGGQISRYALAYMEKNNIPHNTYLWISVDSPHLGSNVPMGDQALLNLATKYSDEASDFYNKELNSPAGKQLLIELHKEKVENIPVVGAVNNYHLVDQNFLNAQTTSQGMTQNRGDSFFQQHYNNEFNNGLPNSKGYPTNVRKIAIVNGSLTGSKEAVALNGQPIYSFANDKEKVLNIRGFQRVNIGPISLGRVHVGSLEANFMPAYGNTAQIARVKKLYEDRTTKSPNINPRGNMDNVPGGYFGAQQEIGDSILDEVPVPGISLHDPRNWSLSNFSMGNFFASLSQRFGGSYWDLHEYNPIHSFIPTFSALGHLNPNQSWANPVNTNLTCGDRQTPFDSYFGGDKNTQHTSFTKESVEWLLQELAGNPQAPHFPIQKDVITGDEAICANVNTTYTINDLCKVPSPVVYNDDTELSMSGWSVQGNLQIVSFTAYSVIVKATSNDPSEGKIIAKFQNGQIIEKIVHLGAPTVPLYASVAGHNWIPKGQSSSVYVDPVANTTSYIWTISQYEDEDSCPTGTTKPLFAGNNSPVSYESTVPNATINWGSCTGNYMVSCQAANECGTTHYRERFIFVGEPKDNPCANYTHTMKISPNPVVNGSITLNLENFNEENLPCTYDPKTYEPVNNNGTVNIKIFDLQGNEVFANTYQYTETLNIPGINLKPGYYALNAITSNGTMMREIILVL